MSEFSVLGMIKIDQQCPILNFNTLTLVLRLLQHPAAVLGLDSYQISFTHLFTSAEVHLCTYGHMQMMGKKAAPKDDVWFGVDDAKKRKQIQDRLAQRARRKFQLLCSASQVA